MARVQVVVGITSVRALVGDIARTIVTQSSLHIVDRPAATLARLAVLMLVEQLVLTVVDRQDVLILVDHLVPLDAEQLVIMPAKALVRLRVMVYVQEDVLPPARELVVQHVLKPAETTAPQIVEQRVILLVPRPSVEKCALKDAISLADRICVQQPVI